MCNYVLIIVPADGLLVSYGVSLTAFFDEKMMVHSWASTVVRPFGIVERSYSVCAQSMRDGVAM